MQMKQTVTLRRTETRELELTVLQPLTVETLTQLANQHAPLGLEPLGKVLAQYVTEYSIIKVVPQCECAPGKVRKGKRS